MAADSSYNGVLKPVVASRQFKDFMEAVEKHLAERKAAAAKGKGWLHASMFAKTVPLMLALKMIENYNTRAS